MGCYNNMIILQQKQKLPPVFHQMSLNREGFQRPPQTPAVAETPYRYQKKVEGIVDKQSLVFFCSF